jgi:hypothetical protein
MMTISKHNELAVEIDQFLADVKSLSDTWPNWRDSHIPGSWTAQWPILSSNQVAHQDCKLVFQCKKSDTRYVSVSVIFRRNRISAVDLVRATDRKHNHPTAYRYGLPAVIEGSHFHQWSDNREYLIENGFSSGLPLRRPTPTKLTSLPHALAALTQNVNLVLTNEQLSFDVPAQGYLSLGGDDDL